jgi:hypothetical protein
MSPRITIFYASLAPYPFVASRAVLRERREEVGEFRFLGGASFLAGARPLRSLQWKRY